MATSIGAGVPLRVQAAAVGGGALAPHSDNELVVAPRDPGFRPREWASMLDDPFAAWCGVRYNSDVKAPATVFYIDCSAPGHGAAIDNILASARHLGLQCIIPPGFATRQPEVAGYLQALAAGALNV